MTEEKIMRIPKVELHCHLDGSLSRSYLEKRLGRKVTRQEISVSADCQSLAEYLEKFDLPCSCLMDGEGLEGAAEDLLHTMSSENVIYAEVRFAPLQSVTADFSGEDAVQAALQGLRSGKQKFGVQSQLLLCLMRHHSFEQNLSVIDLAEKFLGKGVCGIDLAGAEAQYPMGEFMELFEIAGQRGIPFTIHGGECGSRENIRDAIRAGAKRIGHGIAMGGDPELQGIVRDKNIGIEICPISNLQTKSVEGPGMYPLREFLDAGLPVNVNTDNRTVSDTSLTKELAFVQDMYQVTDEEIIQMEINGVRSAFLNKNDREELLKKIVNHETCP